MVGAELDRPEYEPPKPKPVEWQPETVELVVSGLGRLLHELDPVGASPLAPDLWKLTEEDAKAIAAPVSRIANRYDTLRGAAGFSDEITVGAALAPYVKRNLAARGRVIAAHKAAEHEGEHASRYQPEPERQPETPVPEPSGEPERQPGGQPGSEPGSEPEPGQAAQAGDQAGESPKLGVAEAFEHALPLSDAHLPPHETERG